LHANATLCLLFVICARLQYRPMHAMTQDIVKALKNIKIADTKIVLIVLVHEFEELNCICLQLTGALSFLLHHGVVHTTHLRAQVCNTLKLGLLLANGHLFVMRLD
jgi:hypothetical protein